MPVLREGSGEMSECSIKNECCIKEKCMRSKDYFRILGLVFISVIVISILFAVSRYIDIAFIKYIHPSPENIEQGSVLNSFNVYKDFVTVVTALFTLVVTIFGIGGYISFNEIRKKLEGIIAEYENIKKKIESEHEKTKCELNKEYARLKAFCNIAEAKVTADENRGSMAAIRLLQEAEKLDSNLSLTNMLIGDEYFKGGVENYTAAKSEYEKALTKDNKSAISYFKLAKAEFKIITKGHKKLVNQIQPKIECFNDHFDEVFFADPEFLTDDIASVKVAIGHMNMALANEYAKDECLFELGRMFESISKNYEAIDYYKKAYAHNESNYQVGLAFCAIWLRENHKKAHDILLQEFVVRVLSEVCVKDLLCNKLAYALLWYVHKVKGEDDKAREFLKKADESAFNEMFVIAPAQERGATPCSSSPA